MYISHSSAALDTKSSILLMKICVSFNDIYHLCEACEIYTDMTTISPYSKKSSNSNHSMRSNQFELWCQEVHIGRGELLYKYLTR